MLLISWYGRDLHLSVAQLHPSFAPLYLMLLPIVVAAYSARWQMAGRAVGSIVPLRRLMAARLAGDAVGALMPSARVVGDPIRIAFLHADGVPLVTASAGVTLDRLCEMTGNVIAAAVYTLVFITSRPGETTGTVRDIQMSVVALCAGVALLVTMCWRGRRPLWPLYWLFDDRISGRWERALNGARAAEARVLLVFREHPRSFVIGAGMSLIVEALIVVEYTMLLRLCGISLPLPTLLLALLLGGLSRSLPSPAALGALEASQVAALTIAGQPASMGLAVGLVFRLHETLLMAAGLVVCVARGVSPTRVRVLLPADSEVA
jgi:uncharacterized membrane protein YbhN (UPF0104 family)